MDETDERTRKLSNFDKRKSKHLNGFLWIHFGRVLLEIFRKISWMNAKAVYWTSVTVSTFRRWKSVDENGLRCVTKEWNSLGLHYKQFTAWFLRDIWHKYCSWYQGQFKMSLGIRIYAKYPLNHIKGNICSQLYKILKIHLLLMFWYKGKNNCSV